MKMKIPSGSGTTLLSSMVYRPDMNYNPLLVCVVIIIYLLTSFRKRLNFFAARVKSDSDSGVNRAEKKEIYMGEPLSKFWLFASVSDTDTTPD